jgi:hypothetical protein
MIYKPGRHSISMENRRIPSKEKVIAAITQVLLLRQKVESQDELCGLVLKLLRKEDKKYTLSSIRVKRIALLIPEVEVKAKTKKTVRLQKIDKCPICGSPIRPLEIRNLVGKKITIGYRCTRCAYESDLEAFMPMKYSFFWKKS